MVQVILRGGIEDITPDSNGVIDISNVIYIIPESAINQDYELSNFPEKGVYFVRSSSHYTKEFKITNYTGFPTIKTLDPKFLPIEEWTFTLENGSTVIKKVAIGE